VNAHHAPRLRQGVVTLDLLGRQRHGQGHDVGPSEHAKRFSLMRRKERFGRLDEAVEPHPRGVKHDHGVPAAVGGEHLDAAAFDRHSKICEHEGKSVYVAGS
jgi:hypothetical protein